MVTFLWGLGEGSEDTVISDGAGRHTSGAEAVWRAGESGRGSLGAGGVGEGGECGVCRGDGGEEVTGSSWFLLPW